MNKNDKSKTTGKKHHASGVRTLKAHAPQHAATLMRHAVDKPKSHSRVKAVGHLHIEHTFLHVKPSVNSLDPQRLRQAKRVGQSPMISRFGRVQPVIPAAPELPAFQPVVMSRQRTSHKHLKPPATTAELLQRALEGATSHEQPPRKHLPARLARRVRERRITSVSAMVAASAVLIGFALSANMNTFRLHAASSKAGFVASLPGYQPAGYHLSHLNSAPGNVDLEFHSNSDSRSYAINEKPSAWDSQTLQADFVAGLGQDYQTVQTAGRTLFLYGQNDATWVASGIWYQIQTNGALSVHQLVQLAGSM